MDPSRAQAYNLLANVFFRKEDLNGSRKCIEDGLKKERTKRGLRYLSMVLRGTGDEPMADRFQRSIEVAKEASNMDLKDGFSWCQFIRRPRKLLLHVLFQRQKGRGPPQTGT